MIDISKTGAITDWAGLAGKTIVAVEDVPRGRYAHTVDAVLMFTDGTWSATPLADAMVGNGVQIKVVAGTRYPISLAFRAT